MPAAARRAAGAGESAGPAPASKAPTVADVAALLTDYFNKHSVVPVSDPWNRIADGFLIQVHVYRWRGAVSLDAESWGFDASDFEDLDVDFGRLNLIQPTIRGAIDSIATQARQIPQRWGVDSIPWVKVIGRGVYVPAGRVDKAGRTAVDRFKEEFEALDRQWRGIVAEWVERYDDALAYARDQLSRMAGRAWDRANAQGLNDRPDSPSYRRSRSYYVDYMTERHMAGYPPAAMLASRFKLDYTVSFIPKPALELEEAREAERIAELKAADLAEQRREIERSKMEDELERARLLDRLTVAEAAVARKRQLVEEATAKFAADLDARSKRAARDFERAYALELRQRLHESLALAIEGVRKGKLSAQSGNSLRGTLEELRVMLADGDLEMEEMVARLDSMLAEKGGKSFTPSKVSQQIQDLGVVLQTSILALGAAPRVPRRMLDAPPMDVLAENPEAPDLFKDRVRAARERLNLSTSIGEIALEAGVTPRRMRRDLLNAAPVAAQ